MKHYLVTRMLFAGVLAGAGFSQTTTTPMMTDRAAARFLDQATFGPTPASIAELQKTGIVAWMNAQFALNTSDLPDQPILDSSGKANRDLTPVQAAFFANAVNNPDQLRQRVAFALSQMWRWCPPSRLKRRMRFALLAYLSRQCVCQLPRHRQSSHAESGDGQLPEHGE